MARWLGRRRIELETCDSTNDEIAALARQGAEHGTLVIARTQRRGRGRHGRAWYSPPGENLVMSFLLRPGLEPARVTAITLAVGVAVAETVSSLLTGPRYGGDRVSLKWPNDVLLDRRKLAGILTEMSTRAHEIEHVVVGLGLNIATRAFPEELADRATSLALAGVEVAPESLITAVVDDLEIWLDRFFAGGVAAIADRWLALAGLQPGPGAAGSANGRPVSPRVRVDVAGQPVEGTIQGLDDSGFLLVRDDSGRIHPVIAGDVESIPIPPRDKR